MNKKKTIILITIVLLIIVLIMPFMMQHDLKTNSCVIGGDYYLQEVPNNTTIFQTFVMPGNILNGVEIILTDFDDVGSVKIDLYKMDGCIIDTGEADLGNCVNGQFQEIKFRKRPILHNEEEYYIGLSIDSKSDKVTKTLLIPSQNGNSINRSLKVDSNTIENNVLAINYDYQSGPVGIISFFIQIQIFAVILISANYVWKNDFGKRQSNELLLHVLESGLLTWIFSVLFTKGKTLSTIIHQVDTDQFMDFFNSIQYGKTPYEKGVIYPPLANLLYAGLGHIIPANRLIQPLDVRNTQMGGIVFFLYSFAVLYFLLYFMHLLRYTFSNGVQNIAFDFCILLSTPFVFCYERGNIIMLCLVFCLSYYYFNEIGEQKKSFISLAVAIGIKIYPAIYGLMELKNGKGRKGILYLIFVSAVIFMIPFAFFPTGSCGKMISNIARTSAEFQNNGVGLRHDLENLMNIIQIACNISVPHIVVIIARFGCVLAGIMFLILDYNMEKWKQLYICSAILVLFPGFSFTYTLIFMLIPLMAFMKNNSFKRLDHWYLCMYAMIFWPYIVPSRADILGLHNVLYSLTYAALLQTFALITLYFTIIIESLHRQMGRIYNRSLFRK